MQFYDITKLAPRIFLEGPEGVRPYEAQEGVTVEIRDGQADVVDADEKIRVFHGPKLSIPASRACRGGRAGAYWASN